MATANLEYLVRSQTDTPNLGVRKLAQNYQARKSAITECF